MLVPKIVKLAAGRAPGAAAPECPPAEADAVGEPDAEVEPDSSGFVELALVAVP